MTEPKFYTVKDFEAVYRHGRTKVYELIARGELEAVKAGSRTLITAESAEAYRKRLLAQSQAAA